MAATYSGLANRESPCSRAHSPRTSSGVLMQADRLTAEPPRTVEPARSSAPPPSVLTNPPAS
uniref:Uncharacterized protein n=1 Tax=Arundo donax TaxID=35708 RepID=A0A0A9EHU1_ARUDO